MFLALNVWLATSDGAMVAGTASVGVGLAVHAVLSAVFGVVFAALASRLRSAGAMAGAGFAYGAALYLLNFKVLSPTLFTTFEMANQPFELVVHVVFGALLALALLVAPARVVSGRDAATPLSRAQAIA